MADRPTVVHAASHADLRLELVLRIAALTGLALVMLLPAGRGSTDLLGWTPLWLAGLPLVAWWSLHRFRLPSWPAPQRAKAALVPLPARRGAQARRRRPKLAPLTRAA
ncbi:hypothetical protein [Pseudoxanthomonas sp.]|uniref:hypothetical protein n=1 Tax=Pseudoxanthomonas sp. TaxID=1871049 RepID=UPI002602F227|nr:hypothetical protein [Pseudoxanthomonas sp.]WDS35717.1 MAG: hypothetical protein O8I58_15525 [Pseudoxanthomonas sp.]